MTGFENYFLRWLCPYVNIMEYIDSQIQWQCLIYTRQPNAPRLHKNIVYSILLAEWKIKVFTYMGHLLWISLQDEKLFQKSVREKRVKGMAGSCVTCVKTVFTLRLYFLKVILDYFKSPWPDMWLSVTLHVWAHGIEPQYFPMWTIPGTFILWCVMPRYNPNDNNHRTFFLQ